MSKEDFQLWLIDQVRDASKALELRLKDATQLVQDYASGKISAAEASELHYAYDRRWGEALFGATVGVSTSDEQILSAIDKARDEMAARLRTRNAGQGTGSHSF